MTNRFIIVPTFYGRIKVFVPNILYIEARNTYTTIILIDGIEIDCKFNLLQLENILDASSFHRIHKKYIVSLNYVLEYNEMRRIIKLESGMELCVARRRVIAFIESWEVFIKHFCCHHRI